MKIKDIINEGWKDWAKSLGRAAVTSLDPNQQRYFDLKDKEKAEKAEKTQFDTLAKSIGANFGSSSVNHVLDAFKLQSRSPSVVYRYGNDQFTLDDQDRWVPFKPGSTKPTKPVNKNTQQFLNKAAERDNLDIAKPHPSQASSPTSPTASELPVQSPPKQKTATAKPATPNYSGGSTSIKTTPVQTDQTAPQAAPAQQPATNAKVKINRSTNGDVTITDKNNVKWTKPNGKNYWTSPASAGAGPNMVMPGSPEYARMDSLVANLREGQKR